MSDRGDRVTPLRKRSRRRRETSATQLADTDLANLRRFIADHAADIRFTPERGWFVWDGRRWQADDLGTVMIKAKATALSIYDEIRDSAAKDDLFRWAKRSQSARAIKDLVMLAQSEPAVTARLTDFDTDPWRLNVENGVINLKTGKLLPHRREDLHSRMVPVAYDETARCDRWMKFLADVTGERVELIDFLRRAVGYSLTGLTREQVMFFCFGLGANGKSVFLETVQAMLGNYSINARSETIMLKREGGIPNDVARLAGARFVSINETADGQRINEPVLKDLTGQDTVTARFLHREFFDFQPAFKLWLRGNHKPQIRGTDLGIWRRIRLIPFTVTIPEAERDPDLIEKLRRELPGILRWAIEGAVAWHRDGLQPPAIVTQAVQEYRSEMDVLGQFIDERCTVRDHAQVTAKALYAAYKRWADQSGEHAVNLNRFGQAIAERGFAKTRTKTGYVYQGLELSVQDWRDDG